MLGISRTSIPSLIAVLTTCFVLGACTAGDRASNNANDRNSGAGSDAIIAETILSSRVLVEALQKERAVGTLGALGLSTAPSSEEMNLATAREAVDSAFDTFEDSIQSSGLDTAAPSTNQLMEELETVRQALPDELPVADQGFATGFELFWQYSQIVDDLLNANDLLVAEMGENMIARETRLLVLALDQTEWLDQAYAIAVDKSDDGQGDDTVSVRSLADEYTSNLVEIEANAETTKHSDTVEDLNDTAITSDLSSLAGGQVPSIDVTFRFTDAIEAWHNFIEEVEGSLRDELP